MSKNPQIQKHLDFAQGYAQLKMYGDAMHELEQVLLISPDDLDALYWKGVICLEQGKLPEAEVCFRRLIEVDPEQAHVYVHLAYIYRRVESLEKAVDTIKKALQLKPSMPIALYNLACYRAVQGLSDESLRLLQQAVALGQEYRELARTDPDFESIRGSKGFRSIVEN